MRLRQYRMAWQPRPSLWSFYFQPATGLAQQFRRWSLSIGPLTVQRLVK